MVEPRGRGLRFHEGLHRPRTHPVRPVGHGRAMGARFQVGHTQSSGVVMAWNGSTSEKIVIFAKNSESALCVEVIIYPSLLLRVFGWVYCRLSFIVTVSRGVRSTVGIWI